MGQTCSTRKKGENAVEKLVVVQPNNNAILAATKTAFNNGQKIAPTTTEPTPAPTTATVQQQEQPTAPQSIHNSSSNNNNNNNNNGDNKLAESKERNGERAGGAVDDGADRRLADNHDAEVKVDENNQMRYEWDDAPPQLPPPPDYYDEMNGYGDATDRGRYNDDGADTYSAIRICLLGNRESGKSTILEQIRKMSKIPPADTEFHLRRAFIYNNVFNSMRRILEFVKKANITLTNPRNNDYMELVLEEERTHGHKLTETEYEALTSLWMDKTIQRLYVRRAEYCLNDSTKYFLENLPRIYSDDFKPTHDDLLMAYIPTIGVQNVIFTVDEQTFQLFEIGGSRITDRKWSTVLDGLDAIFFTLAISVYDHKMPNGQMEFHYSMGLLEQLCKEQKFANTPIFVFLNECDVFKEKLQRVPLNVHFPEYKGGNSEKDAFRFIREHVRKRCERSRKDMSTVQFYFTCAIDTKQMANMLGNIFIEISENRWQR